MVTMIKNSKIFLYIGGLMKEKEQFSKISPIIITKGNVLKQLGHKQKKENLWNQKINGAKECRRSLV